MTDRYAVIGNPIAHSKSLEIHVMLVEQVAVSFCVWRGVRPNTAPVLAMLRAVQ